MRRANWHWVLVFIQSFHKNSDTLTNRINAWEYDKEMYKKRNQVERLFRRLKGFRRIFSRFNKLDVIFSFFIYFALIIDNINLM